MALVHRLNVNKGVVEHLVTHFANDNDPKTYVDAYDGLTTWVDNSLDMFRVSTQLDDSNTRLPLTCLLFKTHARRTETQHMSVGCSPHDLQQSMT